MTRKEYQKQYQKEYAASGKKKVAQSRYYQKHKYEICEKLREKRAKKNKYIVELWSNGKRFITEVDAFSIEDAEKIIEKHITFEYQIINVQKQ